MIMKKKNIAMITVHVLMMKLSPDNVKCLLNLVEMSQLEFNNLNKMTMMMKKMIMRDDADDNGDEGGSSQC